MTAANSLHDIAGSTTITATLGGAGECRVVIVAFADQHDNRAG